MTETPVKLGLGEWEYVWFHRTYTPKGFERSPVWPEEAGTAGAGHVLWRRKVKK